MKTSPFIFLLAMGGGAVSAQEPVAVEPAAAEPATPERVPAAFTVGAKLGVLLPQVSTELGAAVGGGLELAYTFPVWERRLGLYVEANYTQPGVSRSQVSDPRVAGGSYSTDTTQKELTLGGGLILRVAPPCTVWNGYLMGGVRAYLLETDTNGSASGAPFGAHTEKSSQVGGFVAVGGERRLGPGALLLELGYGASSLPHTITGDVSTGALQIQVGYRLFF
jgi:hypothetical protein